MRPRASTLAGIGELSPFAGVITAPGVGDAPAVAAPEVAAPDFALPDADEPPWAPPRAEPGDMGWDIVYGVKRTMTTHVQPKYNFDSDDEPTSEIELPGNRQS
jgi:hypothetical protein